MTNESLITQLSAALDEGSWEEGDFWLVPTVLVPHDAHHLHECSILRLPKHRCVFHGGLIV